jgi:hypothetical protein
MPAEGGEVGVRVGPSDDLAPSAFDLWGRPLIYRCPGPVHRHGWDLYSVGPSGVDDQGGDDDIVVGEERTRFPTSRRSPRGRSTRET